ncbi:peptide deformylase [Methylobacterium brachiatum]|uniref:peptide deformylase n=1 Tax=Methylobacterium brachiatum TaxID=269660 RepID=UPI000EFBF9CB|nr:peptide deformylase [Methylobacterium brachiatum]AYO83474.1 peptide deformylase [Methylobacterium brachiatum]CAA2158245.1 Peptide deformylase [Methylobacterium brachiatum]
MPARPLILFPDSRLSRPASPVDDFGPSLKAIADDVRDTLLAVSAIGLTAPHIGVPERVVVIRLSPDEDLRVYVNPEILWASPDTATHDEGSVSMPGVRERIARPARLRFGYRDLDGSTHEEEADGFPAAVIQHEIDQLDGIFWIDRLSRLKRDRLLKRFEKTKSTKAV